MRPAPSTKPALSFAERRRQYHWKLAVLNTMEARQAHRFHLSINHFSETQILHSILRCAVVAFRVVVTNCPLH